MKEIIDPIVNTLRVIGLFMLAPIWGIVLMCVMISDCINK